jgi:LmbE family N-acetylglucosaminyl deacetylase
MLAVPLRRAPFADDGGIPQPRQPLVADVWAAEKILVIANNYCVEKFSLLAIFAHPDDETVVSPLLAKYAHEGHQVHLLTLTAGEKGYRKHANIPVGPELASLRASELACSAAQLGLTGHTLLHFPDQGFYSAGANEIWTQAVSAVRDAIDHVSADVLITWGPEGGTGHLDHRATNSIVVQAFQQRSLLRYKPRKLYYAVFAEPDTAPAEDWAAETRVGREFIATEVDCSPFVASAQKAIECYGSQWTSELMCRVRAICGFDQGQVLLRLAYSTVAVYAFPETDVFAGL